MLKTMEQDYKICDVTQTYNFVKLKNNFLFAELIFVNNDFQRKSCPYI